ncbi:MAG: DUF4097 family beta strand repeat protein [Candidatus Marinimicrobia bacterium]|nr:DUF4097 family beta strand repeat protein [Candidatus Neomarinimicrobiota bacterium]
MSMASYNRALILAGLCVPLIGQVAETPIPPEIPEPEMVHNRYQVVLVHKVKAKANGRIKIQNLSGDVKIIGTDVQVVIVKEKIRVKGVKDKDEAKAIFAKSMGTLETLDADSYKFSASPWLSRGISYNYHVEVPNPFSVVTELYGGDVFLSDLTGDLAVVSGGGDIAVSNTSGKLEVKTGGGDIDVVNVEGRIDLRTGGGDIEGRKTNGQVKLQTGGGDIDLWGCQGSFDLATGGGDIELSDLTGTDIEARTGGGDIELKAITANVNLMTSGGDVGVQNLGGNLEAASSGGDLDIENAQGNVVIFTRSGDISINRVSGYVRAKTDHGDVEVIDMSLDGVPDEKSEITTRSGDVYVSYRTDKAVQVEARIIGFSPRYAAEYFCGNVDLDLVKDNGNTIGMLKQEAPYHTIIIETREGSIEIHQGEE